ncbi:MAG: lytic transglycosylase domain-containing protein [bacterium]
MRKLFLTAPLVIALVLFGLNPKASYSSTISAANFLSKNAYPRLNYANGLYFKNAYNNYMRGRYKRAAGQFWLYTARGGILKNYALYYQGLCFFKLKEYHKANYVFLKIAGSSPKFVFYKNAVFYLAISENKNGYFDEEISNLRYIIKRSKKSAVRSYAMFKIYEAELKLKNYGRADKYLLRLYIDYPYFSKIHNIRFKEANLDYYQKIKRGLDLYYDSYYSESLAVLKDAAGANVRTRTRKKAAFIILKDLMKLKSPLFLKKADKCLNYASGKGCYKKYGAGRLKILNLKAYYYYYILHNPQKTMFLLNYTAEKYGFLSQNPMKIYKKIVWSGVLNDLKNGKLVSAAKSLKSFFMIDSRVNASNAKFLFWYGVILKKLGYKNRASFYFNIIKGSRSLRYSYYGIMSGIMINKIGGKSGIYAKKGNAGYEYNHSDYDNAFKKAIETSPSLNIAFKRLKAFLNLKLYFLSNVELQRFTALAHKKLAGENDGQTGKNIGIGSNNNNNNGAVKGGKSGLNSTGKFMAVLAHMLYKSGYYEPAINLTSDLIYNYKYKSLLLNRQFLKILYPRPYFGYVRKYSVHYGVPVNLIYGIMRQESLYNPVCYSSASAIGLMQIIPSTGYYIARRTGCYNFNPSMLYKENINISFGSYYLKTLLKQFDNRKYLAIASYNAGPGAVAYWRNYLLKNDEMYLFIELIPFNQTRNYVKRVLANYYVYNSLYKY